MQREVKETCTGVLQRSRRLGGGLASCMEHGLNTERGGWPQEGFTGQ